MAQSELSLIITNFTVQLFSVVEDMASARIREALDGVFVPARRGPGRPPKTALLAPAPSAARARKKQLCPVPGCRNPAAPVFGMVCAQHRNVPRKKIKEYREARKRAKKKR
jgi:hypothetical protein